MIRSGWPLPALLLVLAGCGGEEPPAQVADAVLLGASIQTMNPAQPIAQALAIRDGRIAFVGDDKEAQKWIGKGTQTVLRLNGVTVLPGLIDSHIHVMEGALSRGDCSLNDKELKLEQAAATIEECAARPPGTGWVVVGDVNPAGFKASARGLDAIVKNRPVFLYGADGHTGWVNSVALKLANITRRTAEPADGRIDRDAAGNPNGFLVDGGLTPVLNLLPEPTMQQRAQALRETLPELHAVGITSYMEANTSPQTVATYVALARKKQLTAHVSMALSSDGEGTPEEFAQLTKIRASAQGEPLLRADLIKLFADGVMEFPTQTAALLTPYTDAKGKPTKNNGRLYIPLEKMTQFIQRADQAGFGVHVHAIGDAAVREALDAFGAARAHGSKRLYSIAHLQLIDPADRAKFHDYNVIASFQLLWAWPDNYSVEGVRAYIGEQKFKQQYPARGVIAAGGTVAGGSDWSVSSFNPWQAMATGISRTNPDEPQRGQLAPDQALTLQEMLAAYTINAAKMMGWQDEIGSLAPGKAADVIVLDRRLEDSTPADTIRATQVSYVFGSGRIVHRPSSP